jgi:hypothetical protein
MFFGQVNVGVAIAGAGGHIEIHRRGRLRSFGKRSSILQR